MAAQTANTKKTGSWDLSLKVIKTGIVSWLIVFLFWGLGSLQYDEIFLPSPAETWTAIKELVSNGTLWADIAASVSRVLKGWGLAVVIAVPVGLVVGHFKAIKYLIGVGDLLTGSLLTFDALTMEFHKIKLPKDTHKCPVCGDNPTILEPIDYEQEVCEETAGRFATREEQ